MKVAFAESNVKGSQGIEETTSYRIAATPHAYKILSSGLYSDKVRAVLREIGCNAQDAHIAAGTPDRPIRVKLANSLDDQFYIQDWGPGLSHEEVMNLYSTYFASTKQTSNDFTGAFGLGSKSPFSYTDSFTVVSTHGGRKRTYTTYVNNKGVPTTALLTEEEPEADWSSGVRVGFAVRPGDYPEFEKKAQEVFQWFRVMPDIRGALEIKPVRYTSVSGTLMRAEGIAGPLVLMGSVAYPLDLTKVGGGAVDKGLIKYMMHVANAVLNLPIGSVQVAASREQLQYDPESVQVLKDHLTQVMRRLAQEVIDAIDTAEKGGWVELCRAGELAEQALPGSMHWNFEELAVEMGVDKARAKELHKFIRREALPWPKGLWQQAGVKLVQTHHTGRPRVLNIYDGLTHLGSQAKLQIQSNTVVAYGTETHASSRAREALIEGLYRQVILVCRDKDHKGATATDIAALAKDVSKAFKGLPTVRLDQLPVPSNVLVRGTKKRKPKNWAPQLDEDAEATFVALDSTKATRRLGDVAQPAFMCHVSGNRWGSHCEKVRAYKTSLDDDRKWDASDWQRKFWAPYALLQKALKLPDSIKGYVYLPATEIRRHYLKELNWPLASDEIRKFVERPDVRDGLKAMCKKWRPALPEEYCLGEGWVSNLAFLVYKDAMIPSVRQLVDRAGLGATLDEIASTTKNGTRARYGHPTVPPEVDAYRSLRHQFGMVEDSITVDNSVTLEDMDGAFLARFPYARPTSARDFREFLAKQPAHGTKVLEFILSKEVKNV